MIASGALELVPWLVQQFLVAAAYVLVCRGMPKTEHFHGKRKRYGRMLECAALFAVFSLLGIALIQAITGAAFLTLWSGLQGAVLVIYLSFFSDYRRNAKIILWCSMFAGMQALTTPETISYSAAE